MEIFHKNFQPLEWTVAKRSENACYIKLCVRKSDDLVLGLHYLGPNAGEVSLQIVELLDIFLCAIIYFHYRQFFLQII